MAKIERTQHIVFSIRLARTLMEKSRADGEEQDFFRGETLLTWDEAFAYLDTLEARGFRYIPSSDCDNMAEDGSCLGHDSI